MRPEYAVALSRSLSITMTLVTQRVSRYCSSHQPILPSSNFAFHHHAPPVRIGPATWVIVPCVPLTSVVTSVEVVVGSDQTWVEPTVDTAWLGANLALGKVESVGEIQVPAVS
jgi:hypothetical protein